MIMAPERVALIRRQAEGILAAGGGWNERTRAGIAGLAQVHGVPFEWVLALVTGTDAPLPAAAPEAPPAQRAPAPGSRPPLRSPDEPESGASAEAGGAGIGAGIAFLAFGLALSIALGWFAVRTGTDRARDPRGPATAARAPVGEEPLAADPSPLPGSSGQDAAGEAVPDAGVRTDRAARVPPVAAIYATPPGFPMDVPPAWARAALDAFAGNERELSSIADRLVRGGAASNADRGSWVRIARTFCDAWPLLDARRRDAALEAIRGSFTRLGDRDARAAARAGIGSPAGEGSGPSVSPWRGAGSAGVSAVLDRPSDDPSLAFGDGALAWLRATDAAVAGTVLAGDPSAAADALDAWIRAVGAAGAPEALSAVRDARILGMLETLLRRGAPIERPGTAADSAATLLDALPWSGSAAERGRIAAAFAAWLMDAEIGARSLHGLTSVLATRRPSPWWDPWLVLDARADPRAREATADRYRAALASAAAEARAPASERVRGARDDSVARWVRVARAVLSRDAEKDLPARVARVAQLVAVVESLRLLEHGRAAEAEARLSQLEDPAAISPRATDGWRDGVEPKEVGKSITADGNLEQDLRKLTSSDQRLEFLRRMRTLPSTDRGPVDAAVLAREALLSRSVQTRAVAQDVIGDHFEAGPNVIAALAAELPFAAEPVEAINLAQRLSGRAVRAGSTPERLAEAVLLLLDLHATLVQDDRHRVDAVARELAQAANAAAAACGGTPPGSRALPEAALRAWFEAALVASREVLPASLAARLGEQAEARRRLAVPGPRAAVAELVGLLEIDAAVAAERRPRSRASIESAVRAAADARRAAPDAVAQLECTARAMVELEVARLAGEGGGA